MKNNFFTGLAIVFPVFVTFAIFNFVISFLTSPFISLSFYQESSSFIQWLIKLFIFFALICFVTLVGFFGKLFLVNRIVAFSQRLIEKTPIAGAIYQTVQEVIQNLFKEKKLKFSKVVTVPFPTEGASAIGFIPGDGVTLSSSEEFIPVYIVGTPNPLMGFVILYPKSKVTPSTLPVEDALKFVMSIGVVTPST